MSLMIDRAFIAVLLLSISGFVFCTIFLPFERYAYKYCSAKTMVFANTVALFAFIIPFYFVVSVSDGSEKEFINGSLLVYEDASKYGGLVSFVRDFGITEHLGTIWLIGMIIYLIYHLFSYISFVGNIRNSMFMINDDIWFSKFTEIKKEKNLSNVSIIGCINISTPCTIGIKTKFIVVPAYMMNSFEDMEIDYILRHEIYHVSHGDLPRKILMMALNCANWFNPLYYILRERLSEWMEVACDEEITKDFDKNQRMKYCRLILKIMELERNRKEEIKFSIGFAGFDVKNYKRRMTKIMKRNQINSIWGKVTVASVVMISMISGNVVAKAADVPVNQMFSRNTEVVVTEEMAVVESVDAFAEEDYQYIEYESKGEFVKLSVSDMESATYEVIYEDGTVEKLSKVLQSEERHAHKLVEVTLREHKKASDGSCTTTYYDGKQCSVCGATWKGDEIKVVTMKKCTH